MKLLERKLNALEARVSKLEEKLGETQYKPFGELNKENQLALFKAWQEGMLLQYREQHESWDSWKYTRDPTWDVTILYRIADLPWK